MVLVKNDPGTAGDVERPTVLEAPLINFARGRYFLLVSPAHEHYFGLSFFLPPQSATVRAKSFRCQRGSAPGA